MIDWEQHRKQLSIAVANPINLAQARELAEMIRTANEDGCSSWFAALARCVVTLCDEIEVNR
jgi:hypothetical protein